MLVSSSVASPLRHKSLHIFYRTRLLIPQLKTLSFYVGFYAKVGKKNKMWCVIDSWWTDNDINFSEEVFRSLFDDWFSWNMDKSSCRRTTPVSRSGMFLPEIFQTRHVLNILISKEQKREGEKKQQQLNKSVSLWLLCCLFADTSSQNQYVPSQLFISPRKTAKLLCLNVYMD